MFLLSKKIEVSNDNRLKMEYINVVTKMCNININRGVGVWLCERIGTKLFILMLVKVRKKNN